MEEQPRTLELVCPRCYKHTGVFEVANIFDKNGYYKCLEIRKVPDGWEMIPGSYSSELHRGQYLCESCVESSTLWDKCSLLLRCEGCGSTFGAVTALIIPNEKNNFKCLRLKTVPSDWRIVPNNSRPDITRTRLCVCGSCIGRITGG